MFPSVTPEGVASCAVLPSFFFFLKTRLENVPGTIYFLGSLIYN
jgi:hypothetical protein